MPPFFNLIIFVTLISLVECQKNVLVNYENDIEDKISDITVAVVRYLEDYNDRNIGKSEWGKFISYENMKPTLAPGNSRGLKKMSMAMMPLVFQVGAASTWMILTTIMTAKSVAIGLLLLVFKIAVSSAKVASFFTLLKTKSWDHHHDHGWNPHGHHRSLNNIDIPLHHNWDSYVPEIKAADHLKEYKTIPTIKESVSSFQDIEYESPKFEEIHS